MTPPENGGPETRERESPESPPPGATASRHVFRMTIRWTGNLGEGTRNYRGYRRDHSIEMAGRPPILGSSGLSPNSDPARHNPDELLVAAVSACHMLWYLHLSSRSHVVVTEYVDEAEGTLQLNADGSGRFSLVILRPRVVLSEGSTEVARRLHAEAHRMCFVANSVNFPVRVEPVIERDGKGPRPD